MAYREGVQVNESDRAIAIVDTMRDNMEWWKPGSRKDFIEAAELLLQRGFSDAEVDDLLSKLYNAVADIYGG